MLVLSRKPKESIVISLPSGELVEFTVVEVRGEKVVIGIDAPKHIPVHRREVYETILRTQKAEESGGGEGLKKPD